MSDVTNKTEMVSVPRELLERLISATKVARGEGSPTQRDAEAILGAPAEDVRLISHAEDMSTCTLVKGDDGNGYFYDRVDAEDVRAVGEEPVAWVNPSNLARFKGDIGATAYQCADHQIPLYRHPQRPVVLPERFDMPHRDEYESADHHAAAVHEANTWNACIDEFERLNK